MAEEYKNMAFLSNGFTSVLELEGSIEWFPCPRFDSPSIFSKILDDASGGYFSVKPEGEYRYKAEYAGKTLILKSTFSTSKGKLELTDFMPMSLPGIIRLFKSSIPFIADIKPIFDYGRINPGIENLEKGFVFSNEGMHDGFEVSISGKFELIEDGIARISKGSGYLFGLYSRDLRNGLFSKSGFVYPDPYESLKLLESYWTGQVKMAIDISKFNDVYSRSLSVILGLMYLPSGGMIAAPTTSLPEIVGGARNWDYRYVWVRDASYAAEALAGCGLTSKSRKALDFLVSVIDPSSKSFDHPYYTVDGTEPLAEERLGWLRGYKRSKPVRRGNAAYLQVQIDIEGAFMGALYTYFKHSKDIGFVSENWWAVESIAEWTEKSWSSKSTSLWEEREEPRHFVHTKVMSWVAMTRAAWLAEAIGNKRAAEWSSTAEAIKEDIMENGFSAKLDSFVKFYGAEEVDAALLTLPLYGFIDAKDPKFASTLKKIEKDLMMSDGLLIRYAADAMGRLMNPKALLSTWLARDYIRMGDVKRAEETLEGLISHATNMLLFAEHIDRNTYETRGNFPQLFPHAGLVAALTELNDPKLCKLNSNK